MKHFSRKFLPVYLLAASATAVLTALSTAAPSSAATSAQATSAQATSAQATPAQATSSLPACPFWAGDVTPPSRAITPFTPPSQIAPALNFSTRMAAPALTGTLVNGQVDLTVSPVPGAVAYRIWRDGVDVAWITDWGQATLTAVDTSPCQNAYYTVVALSSNSATDASMGQLSRPYWLGSDGTLALGPPSPAIGTTINMRVTAYNVGGQTASGYNTQVGMCATDPRVIPWGTYFTVPNYGTCFAGDIGTWISNDAVDLWLPGEQADNWGVQDRTITIIADPYLSSSPTPTPTPTPTPSPTAGACAPVWSPSGAYTVGDEVSYAGDNWIANQWNDDEPPGGSSAAWTVEGSCTS